MPKMLHFGRLLISPENHCTHSLGVGRSKGHSHWDDINRKTTAMDYVRHEMDWERWAIILYMGHCKELVHVGSGIPRPQLSVWVRTE